MTSTPGLSDAEVTRRRRPVPTAIVVLAGLLFTGLAYTALGGGSRARAEDTASSTQIEAGRAMFKTGCSSCHGLNAQGGGQAPSLIGVGAAAVDFQVSTGRMPLARNGPQAERKTPRYTRDEIEALAAYVASLGGGPAIPSADQLAGISDADLAAGGSAFRTNCASCHNFAATGGALANGTFAPGMSGADARQIYEAMLSGPENMPVFSDNQLTPEAKAQIIRYIEHLEAQKDPGGFALGRVGPVPETVVAFLVGIIGCVIFALWIGART
ncbi:MAG: ubiquinol-cytochrome c reductase cytochrome c subunit [Frankiales bacterium]|nr:ubiquinol-cytochrome c reductase cytochrome c subunit [Frankiales bacterium]